MLHEDRVRVLHMLEAIESALGFVAGRQRVDLDTDQMLLFALVRAVEVLGEAAGRVSSAGRAEAPQIPWPLMVAMRNRLIHGYFDIDHDILWRTVTEELPMLLLMLQAIIAE